MLNVLEDLINLARQRKQNPVDGSYTNKLLNDKNLNKEKVIEEINELIESVDKDSNKIHEAADVLYHLVVYLEANNINIEVLNLSVSTKTSKEAANAVGCNLSQIAKSIVFYEVDHKKLVQIFVSGPNRVDVDIFQKHAGLRIEKADANFVRESTGFAIGGVAPLGHVNKPLYYFDETLTQFEEVWCAAGTPSSLFKIKTSDLLKVCEPTILQVC